MHVMNAHVKQGTLLDLFLILAVQKSKCAVILQCRELSSTTKCPRTFSHSTRLTITLNEIERKQYFLHLNGVMSVNRLSFSGPSFKKRLYL